MKTYAKSFSLLLVAALMTMCFTACGNNGGQNVSGNTYAFESCAVDGEDASETITALYSEQNFSFKDDGTCVQTMVWAEDMAEVLGTDPVEVSGTYTQSGNTVKVTFASDEEDLVMEFTVDGDTLTFTEDSTVMVYKLKSN